MNSAASCAIAARARPPRWRRRTAAPRLGRSRCSRRGIWNPPAANATWTNRLRTPRLNAGRALLARYGCVHCHTIVLAGRSTLDARGRSSPAAGPHRRQDHARVDLRMDQKPAGLFATATMPNFQLNDNDARDISAFLIAQSTPCCSAGTAAAGARRGAGRRPRCRPAPASTANRSAPPAMPFRMPPACWWAATSDLN